MIEKILCWLGIHDFELMPVDYDITKDGECWMSIDFDDYDENHKRIRKCKRCGAVEAVND